MASKILLVLKDSQHYTGKMYWKKKTIILFFVFEQSLLPKYSLMLLFIRSGGRSVVSDPLVSVSGSTLVTLVILNVAAQSAALEICLIKGLSAGCKASVTWLFWRVCVSRVWLQMREITNILFYIYTWYADWKKKKNENN